MTDSIPDCPHEWERAEDFTKYHFSQRTATSTMTRIKQFRCVKCGALGFDTVSMDAAIKGQSYCDRMGIRYGAWKNGRMNCVN